MAACFAHFDQIELDVTPFDGVVEGMTLRSNTLTVQNIPPTTLTATITPGAPSVQMMTLLCPGGLHRPGPGDVS